MPELAVARVRGDDVECEGDVDAVFDWGSITKTVTARLLEELDVELDAPITQWVEGPASITLRSLATHTSGLPRIADNHRPADELDPWADFTVEQMLDAVASAEVTSSEYAYSNLGYCLLGHILSLVGGAPIEMLLVERILRPAGLRSSGFDLPTTQGHDAEGNPTPMWHMAPGIGGPGGIHGPIHDLVRWLRASRDRDSRLGWVLLEQPPVTCHDGGTYGTSSFVGWDRTDGTGVAVLSAMAGDATGVATRIYQEMHA